MVGFKLRQRMRALSAEMWDVESRVCRSLFHLSKILSAKERKKRKGYEQMRKWGDSSTRKVPRKLIEGCR